MLSGKYIYLKGKKILKARRRNIIPLLTFLFVPSFFNSTTVFLLCSSQTQAHQSIAVKCEFGLNLAK